MRILAIGAHADDIELGCGGTLAKATAKGHDVWMLVLTASDYEPVVAPGPAAGPEWNGERTRTRPVALDEARMAAAVLGVAGDRLTMHDFPTLDLAENHALVDTIERHLGVVRPDVIFTHVPDDTHLAHRHAAWATLAAARWSRTVYTYEPVMSSRAAMPHRPTLYVDIGDAMSKKLLALRSHASQAEKYGTAWWLRGVTAKARVRGWEIGVQYAEAFEVVRAEWTL